MKIRILILVNARYHIPGHHFHDEYKFSKLYMIKVTKSMSIWNKPDWCIYLYVTHR